MNTPDFVHALPSGVEPTGDADVLDAAALRGIDRQADEMHHARAAAEVSGCDYMIFSGGRQR